MIRTLRNILAVICIILGFIGAFLPVMPTVPFLLAALILAADSPRLKKFLDQNPLCRRYLAGYRGKRPLPWYIKYGSIAGLWLSLGVSFYLTESTNLRILIIVIGIALSSYLATLKSSLH